MSEKVTLSTGVLRKEPGTVSAVINLVNLDNKKHSVTVEVWDWSSYSNPVKLPVLIGNNVPVNFPYELASENLAVMYTDLTGVLFYEIRIMHSKEKNIITNCFGRSVTLVAQQGNTVLDHQLVKIDLDSPLNSCPDGTRLDELERRVDRLDQQVDRINRRLDRLE